MRDGWLQVQGVVERAHDEMCCKKCAPNHPCSQQYGSSHPNHDEPSVVPAGRMAKKMRRTKKALVETLHELGITASKSLLMKSTQAGLVAQTWAAHAPCAR